MKAESKGWLASIFVRFSEGSLERLKYAKVEMKNP